jgi:hypothetical protein
MLLHLSSFVRYDEYWVIGLIGTVMTKVRRLHGLVMVYNFASPKVLSRCPTETYESFVGVTRSIYDAPWARHCKYGVYPVEMCRILFILESW